MSEPTKTQLDYIRDIEEYVEEPFSGTTKNEASEYIERNRDDYRILSAGDWALERGYE